MLDVLALFRIRQRPPVLLVGSVWKLVFVCNAIGFLGLESDEGRRGASTGDYSRTEHKPLPTCNKDNEEILQYNVVPLTRARDFLKIITSFAGLIELFSNPDLSLYYTLTRKRPSKKSVILGERSLFITVFDHKERTTRVYTRGKEIDRHFLLDKIRCAPR
jgi:hypothetical protein